MTATPNGQSAPISPYVPVQEVTPLQAAAYEGNVKTLDILGRSFRLTKKLSLSASVLIDTAQRENDLSKIVDATAKIVHKSDRDAFISFVFEEPDNEDDVVDIDAFTEALNVAIEKVVGRPLPTTGS